MSSRGEVLALCIDRGGYRRGARVAHFIAEWEIAIRQTGGPIGTREFGRWWKESDRTAFRRLSEFREMFPELGPHGTPEGLMRPLLDAIAAGDVDSLDNVGLAVP